MIKDCTAKILKTALFIFSIVTVFCLVALTAVFEDIPSTDPDTENGTISSPDDPEGLSGGAIAGIVIGSFFGALLIAYAICAILYKKKSVNGKFFEKIYPFIKNNPSAE